MKTIIIGIAGGTGSGKSTFTRKLKKEFKEDVRKQHLRLPEYPLL